MINKLSKKMDYYDVMFIFGVPALISSITLLTRSWAIPLVYAIFFILFLLIPLKNSIAKSKTQGGQK